MKGLSPLVAELDAIIVGYADLQANGLIDHFFYHHNYQGQGFDKALMNHVLEIEKIRVLSGFSQ